MMNLHSLLNIRSLLSASLLLMSWGVSVPAAAAEKRTLVDGQGQTVDVSDSSRLIAVSGDITEIVYILGAGDRLIATDTTSFFPPAAAATPKVGYVRSLSAEGLLSQNPTMILASHDIGPPVVVKQVRSAGIPIVVMPLDFSFEGVLTKVDLAGRALDLEAEAAKFSASLKKSMAEVDAIVSKVTKRPKVLFILSQGEGAPMAAGRETSASAIITLAGGENVFSDHTGYKPLSKEAAVAAQPDFILMMNRTVDLVGGREAVLALPSVRETPAGRGGRLIALDGLLLLGFGPRIPEAVRDLARELHPELGL